LNHGTDTAVIAEYAIYFIALTNILCSIQHDLIVTTQVFLNLVTSKIWKQKIAGLIPKKTNLQSKIPYP